MHLIAPVYQKSFGTVYVCRVYVLLVSHCYILNKKTVNNQQIQLLLGEYGHSLGKHHFSDIRKDEKNWTTTP